MALTGGQDLQAYLDQWQQVRGAWQACDDARRNRIRLESQVRELQAMARTARKPDRPDDMTHSPEETSRLISDCATQQRQLQLLLGQCQGKMEALGSEEAMIRQIDALKARIARLEERLAQGASVQAAAPPAPPASRPSPARRTSAAAKAAPPPPSDDLPPWEEERPPLPEEPPEEADYVFEEPAPVRPAPPPRPPRRRRWG